MMKILVFFLIFSASLLSENSFSFEKDKLEIFYEEFVCNQKDQTALAGLTPPCRCCPGPGPGPHSPLECLPRTITVPKKEEKITFVFTNCSQNEAITPEKIFISIKGQTLDATKEKPSGALIDFDSLGDGTLVPATGEIQNTKQYTYPLSHFPKTPEGVPYCFMPLIKSARLHVSVDYPMYMVVQKQTGSAGEYFVILDSDPAFSGENPKDPLAAYNYHVLYDKCEFNYEKTNNFVINNTAVDYFSLPLCTRIFTEGTCNVYASGVPPSFSREKVFETFLQETALLPNKDAQSAWNNLILRGQDGRVLRLMSPQSAIKTSRNVQPFFPDKYLFSDRFGKTPWIYGVLGVYNRYPLQIDLSEQPGYGVYKGRIVGDTVVFTSDSPLHAQVVLKYPTSSFPFFAGTANRDEKDFDIKGDDRAAVIIAKYIAAGFVSGLLPASKDVCLSKQYFSTQKDLGNFYRPNRYIPDGGPWYCLYSKVIHGAIGYPYNVYTFAYDDALDNDGTITLKNCITRPPTVIITLGNMEGTTVMTPPPLPLSWEN